MREILFHAKRTDNGDWIEGFLVKQPSAVQIGNRSPWFIFVPPKSTDDSGEMHNIIPKTVGQYTGLTDRNDTKVFEGDIMTFEAYNLTYIGVVEYMGSSFAIHCKTGAPFLDDAMECHDAVVVGDVHDILEFWR